MKCEQWREEHARDFERKEALEDAAKLLGIGDLCEPNSYGDSLLWVAWGLDLADWSERVRTMAGRLHAAPDDVTDTPSYSGPDLVARWTLEGQLDARHGDASPRNLLVRVISWGPKDCKLDPTTPQVPAQHARIHPGCRSALAGLEAELDHHYAARQADAPQAPQIAPGSTQGVEGLPRAEREARGAYDVQTGLEIQDGAPHDGAPVADPDLEC